MSFFSPKVYKCLCHNCGKRHDFVSEFFSSSCSWQGVPGDPIAYPVLLCGSCREILKNDDIRKLFRAAYDSCAEYPLGVGVAVPPKQPKPTCKTCGQPGTLNEENIHYICAARAAKAEGK